MYKKYLRDSSKPGSCVLRDAGGEWAALPVFKVAKASLAFTVGGSGGACEGNFGARPKNNVKIMRETFSRLTEKSLNTSHFGHIPAWRKNIFRGGEKHLILMCKFTILGKSGLEWGRVVRNDSQRLWLASKENMNIRLMTRGG
jgi:hypothetical protein